MDKPIFPNIFQMWGQPVDLDVYFDGADAYYCSTPTKPGIILSAPIWKVMRVTTGPLGTLQTRFAYNLWVDSLMKWGFRFELPAPDLATVKAYTYF